MIPSIPFSEKGQPSGIPPLDPNGKVPDQFTIHGADRQQVTATPQSHNFETFTPVIVLTTPGGLIGTYVIRAQLLLGTTIAATRYEARLRNVTDAVDVGLSRITMPTPNERVDHHWAADVVFAGDSKVFQIETLRQAGAGFIDHDDIRLEFHRVA